MTQEELKSLVDYDPQGYLIWKERHDGTRFSKTFNSKFAGKRVGSLRSRGYMETAIKGKRYLVHRLVFLYHYGYMPSTIDHANGDQGDNRVENLREATVSQNMQNTRISRNNHSGSSVKGVYRHGKNGWRVQIMKDGVLHSITGLATKEAAEACAVELRDKLHKQFARNQ